MIGNPKRPRRFRLRFTLRTLFVLATLFIIWGGYHTNRSWKERAAQRILLDRGASLHPATLHRNAGLVERVAHSYQLLVRAVWGEPQIGHVHLYAPLDNQVVEALLNLPHLQSAWLCPAQMTDEEKYRKYAEGNFTPVYHTPQGAIPRILSAHPQLQHLTCGMYLLRDQDCAAIGNHPGLHSVSINLSNCSEADFSQIVQARKLRHLSFSYTNITGSDLATIPGSATLEQVECYGAPVGRDFASFVAKCPNLEAFQAVGEGVDDNFAAELTAHPSMSYVDLDGPITPAGFDNMIAKMPSLQWVTVRRTTVSYQRVKDLKETRPNLRIDRR